jgi:hypothetical protein
VERVAPAGLVAWVACLEPTVRAAAVGSGGSGGVGKAADGGPGDPGAPASGGDSVGWWDDGAARTVAGSTIAPGTAGSPSGRAVATRF